MTKIRLNKSHRERLKQLFRSVVTCPADDGALALAYAKAEPLVRACVAAEYPPRDMKLLKKYEVAKRDDCIKLRLHRGGEVMFNFKPGAGPDVVKGTYQGKIFLADEQTTQAVEEWLKATKALTVAMDSKRADYFALIDTAATFEDIEAIWDEAKKLRPVITKQPSALVTLNPQVIERIKADVATRKTR